jgi:hypothetical protein
MNYGKITFNMPNENGPVSKQDDLTEETAHKLARISTLGQAFLDECNAAGNSREMSLAKTKMEEAMMWSMKHYIK